MTEMLFVALHRFYLLFLSEKVKLLTVETGPIMISDYANELHSLHQLRIGSWSLEHRFHCGISSNTEYSFPRLMWKLETGMSELSCRRS